MWLSFIQSVCRCLKGVYLPVRPSFCLSACLSVRPSVFLSVFLSACLSICLFVCLSAFLFVCLLFRQSKQSSRSFKRKLTSLSPPIPQPLTCFYLKRKTTQHSNPAWLTVSQRTNLTSSKNYFTQSLYLPILILPSLLTVFSSKNAISPIYWRRIHNAEIVWPKHLKYTHPTGEIFTPSWSVPLFAGLPYVELQ